MEKTIQAYQDGVLRPLERLPFEERQQVTITISEATEVSPLLISSGEWAAAANDGSSGESVGNLRVSAV
jgi:predicted DNA-binding antitoxin AbrB/MazE fold protein